MAADDVNRPDRIVNLRTIDGAHVDLAFEGGRIAQIGPHVGSRPRDATTLDGKGGLVMTPFADGHVHLDKTFLGHAHIPHRQGAAVHDRIRIEKDLRREIGLPVAERGAAFLKQALAHGTTALRSHVDIDPEIGLSGLEAVLDLKARWSGIMDIQIVAFPQSGILAAPGTADLMRAAMQTGADLVGGLDPLGYDGDADAHLDVVFKLAETFGAGVDIHLHDGGEAGLAQIRDIARRTGAAGLQGRVAISHAFALGEPGEIGPTVDLLARCGVAIMTHGPGPVPMPPVAHLRAQGVEVFAGSDNVRDAWSPFGNADMLERAMIIGYRQGANTDEDLLALFDLATHAPRRVMGRPAATIAPGAPADLVILNEPTVAQALAAHSPRAVVMKAGRIVAQDGDLLSDAP